MEKVFFERVLASTIKFVDGYGLYQGVRQDVAHDVGVSVSLPAFHDVFDFIIYHHGWYDGNNVVRICDEQVRN